MDVDSENADINVSTFNVQPTLSTLLYATAADYAFRVPATPYNLPSSAHAARIIDVIWVLSAASQTITDPHNYAGRSRTRQALSACPPPLSRQGCTSQLSARLKHEGA
ncbi:hypothetical protein ONZ45_g7182 [Pleurotus djamor]|nr:hypothetical protein ONZ45_g7182 [Pleurotus djamor]